MSQSLTMLLLRASSATLPPNFSDVGKRSRNGTAQRALRDALWISVIHVRLSLFTRVPPERLLVSLKLAN